MLPFFRRLVWSWSGSGPDAMSVRSRALSRSSCSPICRCFSRIPGWRRPMRRLPRPLPAAFFAFLLWLERPSPARGLLLGARRRAGALHQVVRPAVPAGGRRRRAALSMVRATGRIGGRLRAVLRPGTSVVAALAAFLVTVWAIYGCTGRPALRHQRALPTASRELAAFANSGEPSFFLGEINAARQLGLLPGAAPGQVAAAVPARGRDRRGRCCSAGIAATGGAWRRCSAPPRSSPASCRRRSISGCAISCRPFRCWRSSPAIGLARLLARPLALGPAGRGRAAAALADRRSGRRRARLSALFQPARVG